MFMSIRIAKWRFVALLALILSVIGLAQMLGSGYIYAQPTATAPIDTSPPEAVTPAPTTTPIAAGNNAPQVTFTLPAATPNAPAPVAPPPRHTNMNELAAHYLAFHDEAIRAALPQSLASHVQIDVSVDKSAVFMNPDTIDGAKAFAVLAASRSATFRASIEGAITFVGREAFIEKIKADPASLKTMAGYDNAMALSKSTISAAFARVSLSAAKIKQASYDIQRVERWANTPLDKQVRLNAILASSRLDFTPRPINENVYVEAPIGDLSINEKYVYAAALMIAGSQRDAIATLNIGDSRSCTFRAYLNIRQCIAATRYAWEHTFCLSDHGIKEMQSCATGALSAPAVSAPAH